MQKRNSPLYHFLRHFYGRPFRLTAIILGVDTTQRIYSNASYFRLCDFAESNWNDQFK